MVEPVRHRQTKEAETDMFDLQPPRHISTLHTPDISLRRVKFGSNRVNSGHCAEAHFHCRAYFTTSSAPCDRLVAKR
jgi:hypothetical protein